MMADLLSLWNLYHCTVETLVRSARCFSQAKKQLHRAQNEMHCKKNTHTGNKEWWQVCYSKYSYSKSPQVCGVSHHCSEKVSHYILKQGCRMQQSFPLDFRLLLWGFAHSTTRALTQKGKMPVDAVLFAELLIQE